jgi:mannose-6-phosphate isomerase-like protein (cupin superfamily)
MEIVHKGWGYEKWIVNNEKYCGKILHFFKGGKCSFHYHKEKDETFYVQSGEIEVKYSVGDNVQYANSIILTAGDTFHVPIKMRHQIIAIMETDLFEFSTEHKESDSFRLAPGDSQKQ